MTDIATMTHPAIAAFREQAKGQVVLVLQGGGALGAYQVGVYQALREAGVEPDWIVGTSIGAINAGIIAGNEPRDRFAKLEEFWSRMEQRRPWSAFSAWSAGLAQTMDYFTTVAGGVPGFFKPNPMAFLGAHLPLGADRAGYYSTAPLRETLGELIDFTLLNRCTPRLTVGAAHVRTSKMRYFDSREGEIAVEHILASGALPPAFPAVRIEGELYWDGGILSNTPTEVIFDDCPRRNSLIFAVHLWNPKGEEPQSIWDVMHRHKDVQYSSRIASHISRQQQMHRMRHVISQLVKQMPEDLRKTQLVQDLAGYGCSTQMHVVRLLAPSLAGENHTKDIDFSPSGIRMRRAAGYEAASHALRQAPWSGTFDPLEGVILHESMLDLPMAAE